MRITALLCTCLLAVPALATGQTLVPVAGDAPVADAAMRGDLDRVRDLLRAAADVNVPQSDGMTALHWAALEGHGDMAETLIYAGAHLDVGTRLGGYTPLHLAARSGHQELAAILVEAGADVEAPTTSGGARPLHFAAEVGSDASIEVLVGAGAAVDGRDSAWEQTPLMFAAAANRPEAAQALLRHGADVNAVAGVVDVVEKEKLDRDERRRRSRRQAALRALEEELEQEEAEDKAADEAASEEAAVGEAEEGEEATAQEAPAGEAGAAEEKPADVVGAGEAGAAVVAEEVEAAVAEEAGAAAAEDVEAVVAEEESAEAEAVAEAKADEEDVDDEETDDAAEGEEADEDEEEERPPSYGELVGAHGGLTPLLYAAREGHADMVALLLEAGADINRPSASDNTSPLLIATLNGHFDLALELLRRGADPGLASAAGTTPLYGALNVRWAPRSAYPQQNAYKQQETGYLELMTALLEAGADPDVRLGKHLWYTSFNFDHLLDSTGATPFWRAAYATDVAAMRLLVAHGADPDIPTSKLPSRGRPRPQGEDGEDEEEEDPSGLPEVPVGGPAIYPIHAASGAGYGEGFAGYAHQHAPDGWLPAVRYLVEELGADVNARDHNGYNPMHHAAARGDVDLILYLFVRGCDATAISRKGQSTADMANGPVQRIQPFPPAVRLLEQLGATNNDNCVSC